MSVNEGVSVVSATTQPPSPAFAIDRSKWLETEARSRTTYDGRDGARRARAAAAALGAQRAHAACAGTLAPKCS